MDNLATGVSAPLPHHPPVDAVQDLAELNQQITAAVVDALQAGHGLSPELAAIIEARDALIARLSHLDE
jgi:phosphate uptake regulator